jgi:hypothetical protein
MLYSYAISSIGFSGCFARKINWSDSLLVVGFWHVRPIYSVHPHYDIVGEWVEERNVRYWREM